MIGSTATLKTTASTSESGWMSCCPILNSTISTPMNGSQYSSQRDKLALLSNDNSHLSFLVESKTVALLVLSPKVVDSSTLTLMMENAYKWLLHLQTAPKACLKVLTMTSIRITTAIVVKTATLLYLFQRLHQLWTCPKESIWSDLTQPVIQETLGLATSVLSKNVPMPVLAIVLANSLFMTKMTVSALKNRLSQLNVLKESLRAHTTTFTKSNGKCLLSKILPISLSLKPAWNVNRMICSSVMQLT
jgi:hypothetical protein